MHSADTDILGATMIKDNIDFDRSNASIKAKQDRDVKAGIVISLRIFDWLSVGFSRN